MDCSPQALANEAVCLECIPDGFQMAVLIAQFCELAGVSPDPATLALDARCIFDEVPEGNELPVLISLLQQSAGASSDPETLANEAECIHCAIPPGLQQAVLTSIVCQLSGGSSITFPNDPDAAKFVCGWLNICALQSGSCTSTNDCPPGATVPFSALCATFCGITQPVMNAIQDLTTQLKAAGLWDLLDVIYPFVGANSGACSLNLKDTTKFAITWHGGVTFSTAGVTGNGSTGYGDTGYTPSVDGVQYTLNSASMGFYLSSGINQTTLGGAYSIIALGTYIRNSALGWIGAANNQLSSAASIPVQFPVEGNYVISRTGPAVLTLYAPLGGPLAMTDAAAAVTGFSLYVLAANFSAVPSNPTVATISFMYAGAGLSPAQVATLSAIVTVFETALGRA